MLIPNKNTLWVLLLGFYLIGDTALISCRNSTNVPYCVLLEKCFAGWRSVLKYMSRSAKCFSSKMVENNGIEPMTSCVQSRRSPSWANSPDKWVFWVVCAKCFWWSLLKVGELKTFVQNAKKWWAYQDLNLGPHPYQGCTLTSWAIRPFLVKSDEWRVKSFGCLLRKPLLNK